MDRVEQLTIGGLPAARLVLQTKTNEGPTTLHPGSDREPPFEGGNV